MGERFGDALEDLAVGIAIDLSAQQYETNSSVPGSPAPSVGEARVARAARAARVARAPLSEIKVLSLCLHAHNVTDVWKVKLDAARMKIDFATSPDEKLAAMSAWKDLVNDPPV
jgi:hypothetical protein